MQQSKKNANAIIFVEFMQFWNSKKAKTKKVSIVNTSLLGNLPSHLQRHFDLTSWSTTDTRSIKQRLSLAFFRLGGDAMRKQRCCGERRGNVWRHRAEGARIAFQINSLTHTQKHSDIE
jgi:hypothetical protein